MLAAWMLWDKAGIEGELSFTSFEAFPMEADEMERALQAFPEISEYAEQLVAAWAEDKTLATLKGIKARVILQDARAALPNEKWQAEAWFLDGFSPAKNPELWDEALMAEVGKHTQPNGSAATYTAAGFVRRGLEAAGFEVARTPGFGRKRHMTTCRKAEV
jgi:tRNA U34 5-methylaminomethyl-2-thiouridine-forming methyltransferase MnmC